MSRLIGIGQILEVVHKRLNEAEDLPVEAIVRECGVDPEASVEIARIVGAMFKDDGHKPPEENAAVSFSMGFELGLTLGRTYRMAQERAGEA